MESNGIVGELLNFMGDGQLTVQSQVELTSQLEKVYLLLVEYVRLVFQLCHVKEHISLLLLFMMLDQSLLNLVHLLLDECVVVPEAFPFQILLFQRLELFLEQKVELGLHVYGVPLL